MARFRYTLQSILDIKVKLETQAKQNFAAAAGILAEEEKRLEILRERRLMYENRAAQLLSGTLDMQEIEENKTAILVMDNYIADQMLRVELATKKLERARQVMTEAMMEKKTYETLREQAFEFFLQEEKKEEGKTVDELVSYTYGQKRQVKE